jgi:fructose-1,6-bisphosphatase/sedoheptulose 1,7-bisphosphatase-like protein
MLGRLKFRNDDERARARAMGITDEQKIYTTDELASGDVMFAATGVTDGPFLHGVSFFGGGATTESVVMRSKSGTVRILKTTHHFDRKPEYSWMTGLDAAGDGEGDLSLVVWPPRW